MGWLADWCDSIVLAILVTAGVLFGAVALVTEPRNVVTAPEDQGTWLRVERDAHLTGHRITVACDTVSGDRYVIVNSGYGDAVAVLPGGCK